MSALSGKSRKIVKEGWLQKRGQHIGTWRRRYFVLREDGTFFGYKNEIESELATSVPINKYTVKATEIFKKSSLKFIIKGLNCATVFERTFHAELESERDSWITVIGNVSKKLDISIKPVVAVNNSNNTSFRNMIINDRRAKPILKNTTTLMDFNILQRLGKGAFGKVVLCEHKTTGDICAIKMISKSKVLNKMKKLGQILTEYHVLSTISHPFLISLRECFLTADDEHLCFVTEFVNGGELYYHLNRKRKGSFHEDNARFYAAEIILALNYLHSCNIVYRDLKLENILLGKDGHIKIVDFGCCKENLPYGALTSTFCGTPMYLAPEMVELYFGGMHCGCSRNVDWWALGVVMYEMICGDLPFQGHDYDGLYVLIQIGEAHYPHHISFESKDLISALLIKNPKRRLGSGPTDGEEIMQHSFFLPINWTNLEQKQIPPPCIPEISSDTDTRYFTVRPYNYTYDPEL